MSPLERVDESQTRKHQWELRGEEGKATWVFKDRYAVEAIPVRTATYIVAASDAPAHVKAQADYVCDGTADNVEIQAAIDALTSGRTWIETVKCFGTFNISSSLTLANFTRLDMTEAKLVWDGAADGTMIICRMLLVVISSLCMKLLWVLQG